MTNKILTFGELCEAIVDNKELQVQSSMSKAAFELADVL